MKLLCWACYLILLMHTSCMPCLRLQSGQLYLCRNYPKDRDVGLGTKLWKTGMDRVYLPFYRSFMVKDQGTQPHSLCNRCAPPILAARPSAHTSISWQAWLQVLERRLWGNTFPGNSLVRTCRAVR